VLLIVLFNVLLLLRLADPIDLFVFYKNLVLVPLRVDPGMYLLPRISISSNYDLSLPQTLHPLFLHLESLFFFVLQPSY
jgi:hypothetical protein